MEFAPITPRRAADEAVAQVLEALRVGDLQAGDRLPSERELAAKLRISRPTVREALRILVDAGVLEAGTNGAVVTSELVPLPLLRSGELGQAELGAVLQARRLIEPRVAQLAAVNGEEEDFEAMAITIKRQRNLLSRHEPGETDELFLQLDLQFHLRLARATRNATVVRMMRDVMTDLESARKLALRLPSTPEWAVDIHVRTLAAIRSRQLDVIDQLMDEHLSVLERAWEEMSGRILIRPIPEFLNAMSRYRGRARPPRHPALAGNVVAIGTASRAKSTRTVVEAFI